MGDCPKELTRTDKMSPPETQEKRNVTGCGNACHPEIAVQGKAPLICSSHTDRPFQAWLNTRLFRDTSGNQQRSAVCRLENCAHQCLQSQTWVSLGSLCNPHYQGGLKGCHWLSPLGADQLLRGKKHTPTRGAAGQPVSLSAAS